MKSKIAPISVAVLVGVIIFIIGRMSGLSSSTAQELNAPPGSSLRPSGGSGQASVASQSKRRSSTGYHSTGDSAPSRSASVADPMDRWQELNEIQDPLERTRQWMQLVNSLAPEQFKEIKTNRIIRITI
jgi:hypothetical protein